MLSDGVFAIAATLLSLDVRGPSTPWHNLSELWHGLVPQLSAYGLSFFVIAIYWLAHRRFMSVVTRVDPPLTVLTLIMLGLVGLLPGATHILLEGDGGAGSFTVYAGLVLLIGLSLAMIWGYASLIADIVPPEIPRSARWFELLVMIFAMPFIFWIINGVLIPLVPGINNRSVTLVLAVLFLAGWRMRVWMLKRMR